MRETQKTVPVVRVQFAPDGRGALVTLGDRRHVACPASVRGADLLVGVATGKGHAHAVVAGRVVASIHSAPVVETTWEESDFAHAEQMAAEGRLFERIHRPECSREPGRCGCSGMSRSWLAWCACTDWPRKKAMQLANDAAREAARYAGMTTEQAEAAVLAEAAAQYERDAGGQSVIEEIELDLARRALAAGAPVAALVARCEARAAEWAVRQEAERVALAALLAAQAATRAQHGPAAREAIRVLGQTTPADLLPSWEYVADAIAAGEAPEAAARRYMRAPTADVPDTFGYAHGTDFEGGEW